MDKKLIKLAPKEILILRELLKATTPLTATDIKNRTQAAISYVQRFLHNLSLEGHVKKERRNIDTRGGPPRYVTDFRVDSASRKILEMRLKENEPTK